MSCISQMWRMMIYQSSDKYLQFLNEKEHRWISNELGLFLSVCSYLEAYNILGWKEPFIWFSANTRCRYVCSLTPTHVNWSDSWCQERKLKMVEAHTIFEQDYITKGSNNSKWKIYLHYLGRRNLMVYNLMYFLFPFLFYVSGFWCINILMEKCSEILWKAICHIRLWDAFLNNGDLDTNTVVLRITWDQCNYDVKHSGDEC